MKRVLPLLLAAALAAVSAPALANDAENLVSYRSVVMETLARHMKATTMIIRGEVQRPGDLVTHATGLHEASKLLPELYAEGTGPDKVKTTAKAEIWTQHEDFKKITDAFTTESAKLIEVAKAGDVQAVGAQFRNVGRQCSACHDSFRTED